MTSSQVSFSAFSFLKALETKQSILLGFNQKSQWTIKNLESFDNAILFGSLNNGLINSVDAIQYSFLSMNPNAYIISFSQGNNDSLLNNKIVNSNGNYFDYAQNNINKTEMLINKLFSELFLRKKALAKVGCKSINAYNTLTEFKELPPLSPILVTLYSIDAFLLKLVWEKFHSIDGSLANKFKQILKYGRDYGIHILTISANGSSYLIPDSFKALFSTIRIFDVSQDDFQNLTGVEKTKNFDWDKTSIERKEELSVDNLGNEFLFPKLSANFIAKNKIKTFTPYVLEDYAKIEEQETLIDLNEINNELDLEDDSKSEKIQIKKLTDLSKEDKCIGFKFMNWDGIQAD